MSCHLRLRRSLLGTKSDDKLDGMTPAELEAALKNELASAKTKPVQQFVVQRKRKLRKFSGDTSGDFDDWRAEAETFID